jgi:pyridoxamine 5'-phosphate oxidase
VRCQEVEFWAGRRNRLHHRLVFTAVGAGGGSAAHDVTAYPGLDDPAAWTVLRRQP